MKKLTKEQRRAIHRENLARKVESLLYVRTQEIIYRDIGTHTTLCPRCNAPVAWKHLTFLHICEESVFSYFDACIIVYGAYQPELWT